MFEFGFLTSTLIVILPLLFLFFIKTNFIAAKSTSKTPSVYPLIGSSLAFSANWKQLHQWISEILRNSPTGTYVLHRNLGDKQIFTANPANVQHILKSHFPSYIKGTLFQTTLFDFLGTGIFNTDGENWKFQRQLSSHEFSSKSLRKFIEDVVKTELSDRLIPILSKAAAENAVLDLQDILQMFAFDNICKIAFGFDPRYLSSSLTRPEFSTAFENATRLSGERFSSLFQFTWKLKRALNIGSERLLKEANSKVRDFAKKIVKQKKQEMEEKSSLEATDLLSRFLNYGDLDEDVLIDIVISFILAGQDTTSAALTWFFYVISCNSKVEEELLKEIKEIPEDPTYDQVKDMVYTHASLCESMRLYPPVPSGTKEAVGDDILPDGTVVKKGMRVTYHQYSMGRMENLWGKDWKEIKPERWLKKDENTGKSSFIGIDSYTYPVFLAGPRICLGKEMAFIQMKMLVVGILGRFRVVPAVENGFEPVFVSYLTAKMQGGFPVKIIERNYETLEVDMEHTTK